MKYQRSSIRKKVCFFFVLLFLGLTSASVTQAENYTYVAKWGSNGSADGQLYNPYGVAVDSSGYVYVADTYNNRVQKFDSNGTYITKWGSNGSADGQFYYPYDVAVDSSGYVYVADSYNNRIQKFAAELTPQQPTPQQPVQY
jgi:DNA-binding beta-propeller fold protein YncE